MTLHIVEESGMSPTKAAQKLFLSGGHGPDPALEKSKTSRN